MDQQPHRVDLKHSMDFVNPLELNPGALLDGRAARSPHNERPEAADTEEIEDIVKDRSHM